jgi:hypothetical protein
MTFLEICQRVRQDAGISGEGPASVTGQIGILSKVVVWVTKAILDIQVLRRQWSFLWVSASGSTQVGKKSYTPSDLNISGVKDLDVVLIGTQEVAVKKWDWWLENIRKTGKADVAGSPLYITISPDNKIHLYPVPIAIEEMSFDYYQKAVSVTVNTDTPIIPADYHEAIVEKALMYYAQYEDDDYRYQQSTVAFNGWINILSRDYLPEITFE